MARLLLKRRRLPLSAAKTAGFTLLELLVALAVGAMVTGGLLFMVVQLMQSNLREAARSDTQRDLQMAIDYIARDVREAVYVYDGACLDKPTDPTLQCPGLKTYLPSRVGDDRTTTQNEPVLAFWRVDPLPKILLDRCQSNAGAYSNPSVKSSADLPEAIRGVPCLSQRMYTLVVYSLNWDRSERQGVGRARITRYELPQFLLNGNSNIDGGWVDPTGKDKDGKETNFSVWPLDKATLTDTKVSLQKARPTGNNVTLVDYVDRFGLYNQSGTTWNRGRAPALSGYVLTPRDGSGDATTDPPRGFYVYVKGASDGGIRNQEVVIRIQGDAANSTLR